MKEITDSTTKSYFINKQIVTSNIQTTMKSCNIHPTTI